MLGPMSYRDDRDADQARIAALEAELAKSRARIEELEGTRSQALVLASGGALVPGGTRSAAVKWAGAPTKLSLERRFEGRFPADKFEDLVHAIREITGDRGRTELMKSSMTWWTSAPEKGIGPFTSITVSVKDGVTTLSVTDRLGQLAGEIYGGIGGGVGGGAIMAPIAATIAMPVLAPVFFAAWFGGAYWGCRALYKRSARKRAEKLQQIFERVAAEVAKDLEAKTPVEQANAAVAPVTSERDRARIDSTD